MRIRLLPQAMVLGALTAALITAGCHIQVDKGKNGEDKNVRVDTPLGGLHVRSDQTSAADLGLPVYPGAQIAPDSEGDRSADIHMGFGKWQLRVKVVTYLTPDAQDKVLAFYKNALGRFGTVLQCDDGHAVGTPAVTSEGLSCRNDSHARVQWNDNGNGNTVDNDNGLSLRAGSVHNQHIVAFKTSSAGTKYSLVEVELPNGEDNSSKTSD